jgi:hypothetical protein
MSGNLPTLHDDAHTAILTMVTINGRQVPAVLEETAGDLLADLWEAGLRHGVQPGDWRAVAALPTTCIDVLVLAEARRRDH